MKRLVFFVLLPILGTGYAAGCPSRAVLDEVVVYVSGETGVQLVCRSDAWLPSPLGMVMPLEQAVIRQAWLGHGSAHHVKMDVEGGREYAERHLDGLQESRGVTRDTLRHMCEEIGHTLEELKQELATQYLVQQVVEVVLTARGMLHVSPADVEAFCREHPQIVPTTYVLQRGEIRGKREVWDEPYSVRKNDLSELFSHIDTIADGVWIDVPSQSSDDLRVVYRVVERIAEHEVPLDERYDEVMHILREKRYQQAYKAITLELLDGQNLEFVHEEDRENIKQKLAAE